MADTVRSRVTPVPVAVTTRPRRRPRRHPGGGASISLVTWLAISWLGLIVLAAVLADLLPLPAPNATDVPASLLAPFESWAHPLGTDGLGRDQLSRIVYGARVSLTVSLVAVAIGLTLGGLIGLLVGYVRGRTDTVVMGLIDVTLAFPGLVLLLTVIAFVGRGLIVISLTIGVLMIPVFTRVARASTLSVASREFVLEARAMGARTGRILFREIAPTVILSLSAYAMVTVGVIIVLEGSLSFLGLSVEHPTPTWGGMINQGRRYLTEAPHVSAVPAMVMFLTVVSLNLVGDMMRSRFDVKGANL